MTSIAQSVDEDMLRIPADNFDALVEQQVGEELQRMSAERAATARRMHNPDTEWFKGSRQMYLALSRNPVNKPPSRAGYYAWAKHNRDGHCPLGDGDLQRIVGKPEWSNGDVTRRIIAPAVKMGLLAPGSVRTCLIAPEGVWFDYGPRTKWCEHHRADTFTPVSRVCFGEARSQMRVILIFGGRSCHR